MSQHLRCNLLVECPGGEDEVGCGYDHCGPRDSGFMVGRTCYVFTVPSSKMLLKSEVKKYTYADAIESCARLGGQVSSLENADKLRELADFLRFRVHTEFNVGLHSSNPGLPVFYAHSMQWEDGTISMSHVYTPSASHKFYPLCGKITAPVNRAMWLVYCKDLKAFKTLCEIAPSSGANLHGSEVATTVYKRPDLVTKKPVWKEGPLSLVECPGGHLTHSFSACDPMSGCSPGANVVYANSEQGWHLPTPTSCPHTGLPLLPPSFQCRDRILLVPYTLVCDHRTHCVDRSDEDFCQFEPCGLSSLRCTSNQQCYDPDEACDGSYDCVDGEDERLCLFTYQTFEDKLQPPAVVDLTSGSMRMFRKVNVSRDGEVLCPDTHFLCPSSRYCMPVFLVCNGVFDCEGHEDEDDCASVTCKGYYRCRSSRVCVHYDHLCDGIKHCPQSDDEVCDVVCPPNCICHGLAFSCRLRFSVELYPQLRYLHASGTELQLADFKLNDVLIHLGLGRCSIVELGDHRLEHMHSLDLSDNLLVDISYKQITVNWPRLRELSLAGNPLEALFQNFSFSSTTLVSTLDLSRVHMDTLEFAVLSTFTQLRDLNLSHCRIQSIASATLNPLPNLRSLDLSGSTVAQFPQNLFRSFSRLQKMTSANFKLCCPANLPVGFNPSNCFAPSDELSSCSALLRSDLYRVVLCLFACMAMIGNAGSFVARVFLDKSASKPSFIVFVIHLCVADFLMGFYLAVIGIADSYYGGRYVWVDTSWRNSLVCQTAGVFSIMSSEVSAVIVCLITLDRFIVMRFPFSQLRFRTKSSNLAGLFAWLVGFSLCMIPFLPVASDWDFYGQTGICIPLPITRKYFPGAKYSFGIIIVFNFVLFLLIALGQMSIYISFRNNAMSTGYSSVRSQDASVARRLITIAVTDFLCWFPIGLLGILSSYGLHVSGEVTVVIAICVMPLNSAVNPFLYTLNLLLEKRNSKRDELLFQKLLTHH